MENKEKAVPTLAQSMVYPLIVEESKQGFFGKEKIRFGTFLAICGYVYESTALASTALVNKSSVLGQILAFQSQEAGALTFLRNLARTRSEALAESERYYVESTGFGTLITESELNKIGHSIFAKDAKKTGRVMNKNWKINNDLLRIGETLCLEGFGFGLEFPEQTRHMYKNAYEDIDLDEWELMHNSGLNIPKNPTIYPIEQRENDILTHIAEYVHEYRPELEDSLDLKHLLS
ncbi:MAG: hypothetical protein CL782_06360 [Chloroflexi bacterium]|nr:hypothetical protein [Chloroflexota bacterium]|tara:strand:- start:1279 stop:1980 length:702 start_codon:yes stop_codon:yes gene_type:complete